jgi:hypothetical protein
MSLFPLQSYSYLTKQVTQKVRTSLPLDYLSYTMITYRNKYKVSSPFTKIIISLWLHLCIIDQRLLKIVCFVCKVVYLRATFY